MTTAGTPNQIGDLPPLGRPANSALLAAGVTTLEQVSTMTTSELLALHGVGPKAIRLLDEGLAARGLAFAAAPR